MSEDFIKIIGDKYDLTRGEIAVLELIFIHKKSPKEIAQESKKDVSAINHRMLSIYNKLGIECEGSKKKIEMRKLLNHEFRIYSQLQSQETYETSHHLSKDIDELRLEIVIIKKYLEEEILPSIRQKNKYNQNYKEKDNSDNNCININSEDILTFINRLEDKIKNPDNEVPTWYIIDNIGKIMKTIVSKYPQDDLKLSLRFLELLKSISLDEAKFSARNSSMNKNSEINLD